MELLGPVTCPLPQDPTLAEAAEAMNDAGSWGFVVDNAWRLIYMTDDIRLSNGALSEMVPLPLGVPWFSSAAIDVMLRWSGGVFSLESWRVSLRAVAGWLIEDTPGGVEAARKTVDPRLVDVLDDVADTHRSTASTYIVPGSYSAGGQPVDVHVTALRMRTPTGAVVGTVFSAKPAAGMAVLGAITAAGDLRHFARMQRLARHTRQPAAILFADLERSSPLARSLSTSSYFALGRRIVRAADRSVVDAGGMVGRHVGDGVVAFFLARDLGSETAAARACIAAARALRATLGDVAQRSDLRREDVVLRFGLHWGATLHIGQITTVARAEVNALGDEVNEAARIEACATGGRTLASKQLVERLEPVDAAALDLDTSRLTYTPLGELATASEKARRDAPAIAVTEV